MYLIIRPASVRLGLDHGARLSGKIKTVLQYTGVIGLLALLSLPGQRAVPPEVMETVVLVTLAVLVAASLVSLYWYLLPLFDSLAGATARLAAAAAGGAARSHPFCRPYCTGRWRPPPSPGIRSRSGMVLFHVLIGAFLFWRHEEFAAVDPPPHRRAARLALPNALTLLRLSSIPTLTLMWSHGTAPRHHARAGSDHRGDLPEPTSWTARWRGGAGR